MASFQDKIGWKAQRKSENKNCRYVLFRSYPMRNRKFQKNSKNYKIPLRFPLKTKQGGKGEERAKIKIIVPFCSNHIRNTKFQKNSKKIQKIIKYHYGFL